MLTPQTVLVIIYPLPFYLHQLLYIKVMVSDLFFQHKRTLRTLLSGCLCWNVSVPCSPSWRLRSDWSYECRRRSTSSVSAEHASPLKKFRFEFWGKMTCCRQLFEWQNNNPVSSKWAVTCLKTTLDSFITVLNVYVTVRFCITQVFT